MSHLRELSLTDRYRHAPLFSGFDAADFAALVASVPQIETLRLCGDCNAFPAAVRLAGEHCRQLRELTLHQRLVFDELARASPEAAHRQWPLFPNLRRLSLDIPSHRESYDNGTESYYDDES
jgi:hypothetical protein